MYEYYNTYFIRGKCCYKKLPEPHGPLSNEVLLSAIKRANNGVAPIIEQVREGHILIQS